MEIFWCIITSRIEFERKKMSVGGSFPNMEVAKRPVVGHALINLYSALSVVLNRDVNCGSVETALVLQAELKKKSRVLHSVN